LPAEREIVESKLKYLEDTLRKLQALSTVGLEEFLSREDLR